MIALVVGAALAVAALIYVLLPLFDAVTPLRARLTGVPAAAPESAIDALREIEFDRATGKLSDDDYASLKATYTRSALVELRTRRGEPAAASAASAASEQVAASSPVAGVPSIAGSRDPAEAAVLRYRAIRRSCDVCGPRPEPDPAFCSSCGKYLKGACATCGAAIDAPASRFCANCGTTLAA
ncbi:MAG TPA: zinc ribbon domain-containing protein [Gemmatimonadaceae bacterium]|nr:zinc ribbon domain-containing protein [Gemmatimonadaceae bacterium]